jgi:chorismate mutase
MRRRNGWRVADERAAAGRRRRPDPETPEVRRLRAEIDAVDRRIVELLAERLALARDVGRAKRASGQAIHDPEREREVLLRVSMANPGPLPQADLLAIYTRVIEATRRFEAADGLPTANADGLGAQGSSAEPENPDGAGG